MVIMEKCERLGNLFYQNTPSSTVIFVLNDETYTYSKMSLWDRLSIKTTILALLLTVMSVNILFAYDSILRHEIPYAIVCSLYVAVSIPFVVLQIWSILRR